MFKSSKLGSTHQVKEVMTCLTTVMSYTSSDPEYLNRDPETSSLASVSTTTSQTLKTKKKPWSKFKSSFRSLGEKMSSKPKFTEPTESSEQKRVKKSKKNKTTSGSGSDIKPSPSEETPREKSPTKSSKGLIKKLSVESISTPFVGYQPKSVSPTRSYSKVHKSGSTSESNLSISDIDTPKKSLTMDRNTKYNLPAHESSPDSGRVSQTMDTPGGSRPPSQITEEDFQKEVTSDFSVDSDYTSPQHAAGDGFDNLVTKTEQFAKSLVSPKHDKEKDVDVSEQFIQAETVTKYSDSQPKTILETKNKPNAGFEKNTVKDNAESLLKDLKNNENEKLSKQLEPSTVVNTENTKPEAAKQNVDEVEGRRKKNKTSGIKKESSSTEFIESEITDLVIDDPKANAKNEIPSKSETNPEKQEEKPVPKSKSDNNKEKPNLPLGHSETKPEENKENKLTTDSDYEKNKNISVGTDEEETRKIKEEEPNIIITQTDDDASTSTPVDTPETISPVSDVGPLSPQAMSVEEKLEAFLKAEGWSGTIKDVSVKSSADGSQQPDKRECLYKILVIGELGTGKTSIIKRYVHQFFSQHYRATIGVDFALKVLNWDPNTIIRLQLWDIAGQERFGNMTRVYYKEAVGAFIVFDVTRSATFDAVLKWKQDLDSKVQLADGSPIPCVLLANKCDQQKEGIVNTPAKMDEYCKENNFSAWFETSAKENINIDEAAKSLVTQILQNDKMSQNGRDSARDGSKFPLDGKSEQEGRSCAC